jgi:PIN domain
MNAANARRTQMTMHYVLVDFENVQPRNVGLLRGGPFRIKVFVGASQSKVSFDTAQVLQSFGPDADYVQISGNGPNALDFHIAYYIGHLAATHPEASFHIISKDTGFDPLIKHLKSRGIECRRSAAIADIPHIKAMSAVAVKTVPTTKPSAAASAAPSAAPAKKTAAPVRKAAAKATPAKRAAPAPAIDAALQKLCDAALDNLRKRDSGRPSTVKTLIGTIRNLHKPPLPADQLQAIVDRMVARGNIRVSGTKVTYALD